MSEGFQIASWFIGQTITLALIMVGAIKFLLSREEARIMEAVKNNMSARIAEHDSWAHAHRPAFELNSQPMNAALLQITRDLAEMKTGVAVILNDYRHLREKVSEIEAEEDGDV